ncbi:MAG TPA: S1/P1 nuclease [Thermoanaerobaculia bacterium]|nr:S1/P1 nuclease [Thermoanaerobaculia bacterium]
MKRILLAVAAVFFLSSPLPAWDAAGHQVIARIAWDNLTPAARQKAVALLRSAPPDADLANLSADGRELFLKASTWPDIVRDKAFPAREAKYHHGSWHYTNFFWEQPADGPPRDRPDLKPAAENAVERLGELDAALKDPGRSDAERAVDLAWLLHLAGDIHQPLHASARVTPEEPEGDRGGNLFLLAPKDDDNLHWYWDSILVRRHPREGMDEARYVEKWAERIERREPRERFAGRLEPGRYEEWAREGFATTKRMVYPRSLQRGVEPSWFYKRKAFRTARPALALAGYRLADLLNRRLG